MLDSPDPRVRPPGACRCPTPQARITELEIALAHQERVAEDLSDVVREQADRLARLERRLAAVTERVASLEARPDAPPAERRPPHW